jgi:hypothetical protein
MQQPIFPHAVGLGQPIVYFETVSAELTMIIEHPLKDIHVQKRNTPG